MTKPDLIILPGLGGSGKTHWQSLWERDHPRARRFRPSSWDEPILSDWMAALTQAVSAAETPPVLVAHSLSCLLVAHWQKASAHPVAGAFLVGVPDPKAVIFPPEVGGFADVPETPFRFPALIVASSDDPYATLDHTRLRAAQWGAGLVEAGALGHINGPSGIGDWPQGRALLAAFGAGMGANGPTRFATPMG